MSKIVVSNLHSVVHTLSVRYQVISELVLFAGRALRLGVERYVADLYPAVEVPRQGELHTM